MNRGARRKSFHACQGGRQLQLSRALVILNIKSANSYCLKFKRVMKLLNLDVATCHILNFVG